MSYKIAAVVIVVLALAVVAGAAPLSLMGPSGYLYLPTATVVPNGTVIGQADYITKSGGEMVYHLGTTMNNLEFTGTQVSGPGEHEDFYSLKYNFDFSQWLPQYNIPVDVAVGATDVGNQTYVGHSYYVAVGKTFDFRDPTNPLLPAITGTWVEGGKLYHGTSLGLAATWSLAQGELKGFWERMDNGDIKSWGVSFSPASMPELSLTYINPDFSTSDVLSVAYSKAF